MLLVSTKSLLVQVCCLSALNYVFFTLGSSSSALIFLLNGLTCTLFKQSFFNSCCSILLKKTAYCYAKILFLCTDDNKAI